MFRWMPVLSPSVERARDNRGEKVELAATSGGACRCNRGDNSLSPSASKRGSPEDTLLGKVKGGRRKFGPLRVILSVIPAVCADHEVRQSPAQRSSLTNTCSGICCLGEKDRSSPLTRCRIRRILRFTPNRCRGARIPE